MSHLSVCLDQIAASCQGIDSLPFPRPKVFTNALLYNDDITSLIRDTEAHERALFSVPPPTSRSTVATSHTTSADESASLAAGASSSRRRQTVFNVTAGEVTTGPPSARPSAAPRRQTAVAAVLGGDLHAQITRGGQRGKAAGSGSSEVDINILLRGAEKLCSVYALPGALERIPALRQKYAQQSNTLAYYEAKVAEQARRLEEMNRDWRDDGEGGGRAGKEGDDDDDDDAPVSAVADMASEEDLRREEEEVRELERRKRELQNRLRAMEKDLGGLRNM